MIYAGIGSRSTPSHILSRMTDIATILFMDGWRLRSGHADGADLAFEQGGYANSEIWIPWKGFNGSSSSLLPTPAAFKMAAIFHPAWDRCSYGAKALHARNCHQILGIDLNTPVSMIICWTSDGKASGGTGQAIRIAETLDIPVHNLYNGDYIL